MPHVMIDYSANLAAAVKTERLTARMHQTMLDSNLFKPASIKTRAKAVDDFQVGVKGDAGSFVHAIVFLLDGRTLLEQQGLSQALFDTLRAALPMADSVTVDIRDLNPATYRRIAA